MAMRFGVLGTIEAWHDEAPMDVGHARQRLVLAALLVDVGRVVPADVLVERVWGDRVPRRGRSALYGYMSRLRQALAEAGVGLVREQGGYRLAVEAQRVDLHRFHALVGQARAAGAAERAVAVWDEALGLWRGEAFAGADTPWFNAQRALLDRERLAAQLDLTDARLRLGLHAQVLAECSARTRAHPLDERVAEQLMLALYRCGRQNEALEDYERIRRLLAQEMGVDPGPALQRLHQRMLTGDPGLDLTGSVAAVPAAGPRVPVPRQLPALPAPFVGRNSELAALDGMLEDSADGSVLVISTIDGAGGIGKTWLALRWAHRRLENFPDGQLYVNLRGFDPVAEPVPAAVAVRGFLDALGVAPQAVPAHVDAQAALYRSLVADRRMLVLLDNARDTEQVIPLLPGSATCTVLVTSRHRLPGLVTAHGARSMTLDVLPEADARRLLTRHLGTGAAAEPDAVTSLVQHCAGLPLALSITAARAAGRPHLPLAALADELHRAVGRLDALDAGDLISNLRTVFATSCRALSSEADRLFRFLGLVQGPDIGHAAAASLMGIPPARTRMLLAELEAAHILQQHRPGRYQMHDLVRLYAAELAEGIPDQEAAPALDRLLDHYLHTAFAAIRMLDGPHTPFRPEPDPPATGSCLVPLADTAAALQWFHDEHRCLLAAQAQAAALGRHRVVWQLAWTLLPYQLGGHHLQEYVTVWNTALAAAEHDGDNPGAMTLARWRLGFASARAGDHAQALDHLRLALALAERTGDIAGQAHIHRTFGRVREEQGDNERALDHAMHALRLYLKVDNPFWQANQLNAVGWMHARLGFHTEARAYCERALALFRAEGLPARGASTLDSLGYIAHHTGRHHDALDHYEQALALFRETGDTANEADTLVNAGETHRVLRQYGDARRAWQRALELYRSQGRTIEADNLHDRLEKLKTPKTP